MLQRSAWDKMLDTLNPPEVRFSKDFKTISTASLVGDGIQVWSASDKRPLDNLGDSGVVSQMEFSSDGRTFAWSHGPFAYFYGFLYERMVNQPLKARSWIHAMAFSPSSAQFDVVATGSSAVELWNSILGDRVHYTVQDFGDKVSVEDLAFSSGGGQLAAAMSDGTTNVWQLAITESATHFAAQHLYTVPALQVEGSELSFSPNGQRLAVCTREGQLQILNAKDGSEIHTFSVPLSADSILFSPDASLAAVGYGRVEKGFITIVRVSDGREVWSSGEGRGPILDMKFSDDGKTLTAGYADGSIKTYNIP